MKKKQLHIYTRVSSAVQVERYSLTAQRNAGIKKAKELGYEPVFYEERGKSADKDNTLNRPEMNRLLKECEAGNVTDIFVTELDRFTRRIELILEIDKMFQKNNIVIHAAATVLDLTDSDSRFYTLLQSLLGERENRVKTDRSIRGMTQGVKQRGLWVGVFVPFGYLKVDKCLSLDDEEAVIYKEMVEMALSGMGITMIAKNLNERGIKTRARKVLKNGINPVNRYTGESRHIPSEEILWAPNTVYSIFKNPLYKGQRRWKGETVAAPAIIDAETWERLQISIKKRRNCSDRTQQHHYMLKGMLRCGICGRNIYGRIKPSQGERFYMCSSKRLDSCGLRSPNLDTLNDLIWKQVINSDRHLKKVLKDMSEGHENDRRAATKTLRSLEKRLDDIKKLQERLIELYELGRIDLQTFDDRNAEHEANLLEVNLEIDRRNGANDQIETDRRTCAAHIDALSTARDLLNDLSEMEKRDVVREVVEEIIVNWDEKQQAHLIETRFRIGEVRYTAHSVTTPVHLKNPVSRTWIELTPIVSAVAA